MSNKLSRRKHARLIKYYLEGASSDLLELTPAFFEERFRHERGIYALYKDSELYYIGLTKDLVSRLQTHLKDHLAKKWNRFSVYVLRQRRYLKPVESLILTVAKPRGNERMGRLPRGTSLKPLFKKELSKLKRSIIKAV